MHNLNCVVTEMKSFVTGVKLVKSSRKAQSHIFYTYVVLSAALTIRSLKRKLFLLMFNICQERTRMHNKAKQLRLHI